MIITTRTLWLMTAVAFLGYVLPWQAVIAAEALVLLVAVIDAWQVREPPAVTTDVAAILSRGVPSDLVVGGTDRRIRPELRQPSVPDLDIEPREARGALRASIVALRRGSHRLPRPVTRRVGALGFGGWLHRPGDEQAITVYPDMPAARHLASAVRVGTFREEGKRSRGPLGLGTEFESIRGYLPDDDIRLINWRATAKLGHPMSNQYRIEQDRDIICVLDCGRLMSAPIGDVTRLDVAVDAVAALAAVADQAGDRIGLVAFDRDIKRLLRPRRDGGAAVVRAIHDLEPSAVDSDYDLALRSVLRTKRAFVLILTDLVDEVAVRPLVSAVPQLARKHAVTVAGVIDPELQAMITDPGEGMGDVMRAATALRFLTSKEQASALLTHRGVDVIEATRENFSARCVATYLRAKRRARL